MGRKRRRKPRGPDLENCETFIVDGAYQNGRADPKVVPRNLNQKHYINILNDWSQHIVFALGPAGTGKTMLAAHKAIQYFKSNKIDKIIITRPTVSVDEDHGFLPGDIIQKMTPWMRPILDIFYEYYTPKYVKYLLEQEKIEIAPLAYMRGRTFKYCWVLADEMQNATKSQMKMLLTRIGDGSKMVVTGDLRQHDRGYEKNGLLDFVLRLKSDERGIKLVEFDNQDIERHPAVVEVLKVYGDIVDPAEVIPIDLKNIK
tara:strand:- start:195 stop:968 length:774 start_codon:yes stop_codon:yes gene_type:complete